MSTDSFVHGAAQSAVAKALAEAAEAAGLAPSIHNTQPWRCRLSGESLDLYADDSRALEVTDPDTRLATLSCGVALHHARITLAAMGWHATVHRMPEPDHPGHLAHLSVAGAVPVDPAAVRQHQAIAGRHTDRRPVGDTPVSAEALRGITDAVESEGVWLHVLPPAQVLDLAAATDRAQRIEGADPAWRAEVGYWTGGARPVGTGVPDSAIPRTAPRTTVPGRDFGHGGDLTIDDTHDRSAIYAILYGREDSPADWLRAGEALSAAWLTATALGVGVLPLSAVIEVADTRQAVRRLLADLGHPYLALRLGMPGPADGGTPTPRLPADRVLEQF